MTPSLPHPRAIIRNENHFDYTIIGGGCFGASAALALIGEWPDARIVWFEGTHTHTASQDKSKIIRAAYEDEEYVAFVERTLEMWQADPLYREHYHQTGCIQVVGEGSHANTIKGPNDRMISVTTATFQQTTNFQLTANIELRATVLSPAFLSRFKEYSINRYYESKLRSLCAKILTQNNTIQRLPTHHAPDNSVTSRALDLRVATATSKATATASRIVFRA
jgi:hypothetical protein